MYGVVALSSPNGHRLDALQGSTKARDVLREQIGNAILLRSITAVLQVVEVTHQCFVVRLLAGAAENGGVDEWRTFDCRIIGVENADQQLGGVRDEEFSATHSDGKRR